MSDTTVPKAIRWKRLVLNTVIVIVAILIGVGFAGPLRSGMTTVGRWIGFGHDEPVATTDRSGQVQYYTCGMHPWVILPKPGDCPICHMKLTPIDPDKFTGEITIDPVIVQNMGVRVQPVVTGPLTRTIRTVGTIDYNERAVRDVNIKTPGWIEKLYVDFVGAHVKTGQPLFELYSPQLFTAQEEYLLSLKNKGRIGSDLSPDTAKDAVTLHEAARTRLEYFDITEEQIKALEQNGKPSKTMTIRSPHTGFVIAKHANEGMKVDPGMQVYRIADLSKVWVLVTLYEYQLPYVEEGMKATMSLPYIPGQTFEGEVIYIYPYLETKTREVQVRLEFENPQNLLKPGMFANVTLQSTLAAEKTLAPRSAVIDTGERQVAFVSRGEGKFEPRDVRIGIESGDGMVEIISGLKPGEMVVTSGQFLIDSEAKMREALAKMIRGELASEQKVTAKLSGTASVSELPGAVTDKLNTAIEHYLVIGDTLAGDTIEGIADHARKLATAFNELIELDVPSDPHLWYKHQDAIATARSGALKLTEIRDLTEARLQFAKVSTALETLLMATGVPPSFGREVQVLHCPMYRSGQGGTIWLQTAEDVRNPYFGSVMRECFDQRKALPVTGGQPEKSGKSTTTDPRSTDSKPNEADQTGHVPGKNPQDKYPIDFCLISGAKLGSMGAPATLEYEGRTLKFCCDSCISAFQDNPTEYLKKLDEAAKNLGQSHGVH
ncbi:MAG: hypothetical protein KatS3mg104_1167 [Phycisphaerae bacterium]|jgi:RND family efflux transporter MFP subunit|nr:MAG: hypothetical protein KatS3mg104_1167 [Phycisphaerae bacterium]